jgi:hypothetical protein
MPETKAAHSPGAKASTPLIVGLSQFGNDPVTADIGGILVDVEAVTTDRGTVVIVLDPEDLQSVLRQGPREWRTRAC